jgi:hypothetical protein
VVVVLGVVEGGGEKGGDEAIRGALSPEGAADAAGSRSAPVSSTRDGPVCERSIAIIVTLNPQPIRANGKTAPSPNSRATSPPTGGDTVIATNCADPITL